MFAETQARPSVRQFTIAEGDAGIRQTCRAIRELIEEGKLDPEIRYLTARVLAGIEDPVYRSQRLVGWFMSHVRYQRDDHLAKCNGRLARMDLRVAQQQCQTSEPVEILTTAREVLRQGFGDCDDFCVALGAMHELAGMPVRLVTIAADPGAPAEFTHVYLIVQIAGRWIPIDAVNPDQPWGWEHPAPFRKQVMC